MGNTNIVADVYVWIGCDLLYASTMEERGEVGELIGIYGLCY